MLPMEPVMKIVRPITHVRLWHGFSAASGDFMPMDCRFWPMLIPTDEIRPIIMPSGTVFSPPSMSHAVVPFIPTWWCSIAPTSEL